MMSEKDDRQTLKNATSDKTGLSIQEDPDRSREKAESENEAAQTCKLIVMFDEKKNPVVIEIRGGICGDIFKSLPPIKREFWLRRATEKVRSQIEEAEART